MKMKIKDLKKWYKNNEFHEDVFGSNHISIKGIKIDFDSVCDIMLWKKEVKNNNWSKEDLKAKTIKKSEKLSTKIDLIKKSFTDNKIKTKTAVGTKGGTFSYQETLIGNKKDDTYECIRQQEITIFNSTQKMTPFNTPVMLHELGHAKFRAECINGDVESNLETLEEAKKRIETKVFRDYNVISGKEGAYEIGEAFNKTLFEVEHTTIDDLFKGKEHNYNKKSVHTLIEEEMAWIEAENFARDFAQDLKLVNFQIREDGKVLDYGEKFDNSNLQLLDARRVESVATYYESYYRNDLKCDSVSKEAFLKERRENNITPQLEHFKKLEHLRKLELYNIDQGFQYLYDYSMDISTAKQLENYFEVANNRANLLESGKFSELEEVDKTLGEIVKDILESEKTQEHLNMRKIDMIFKKNKEIVEELKDIDIESFEIVYGSIEKNDNNHAIKNFIDERSDCYVMYKPEEHRENLNEFYNNIPKRAQEKTELKQLDLSKMSVEEIDTMVKEEWTKTFFKNEPFKLPNEIVDLVEDFEEFKFNEVQRVKQEVKNLSLEDSYEIKKAIKTYEKENDLNGKEDTKSVERER